jgi:HK97 family phage portal protein
MFNLWKKKPRVDTTSIVNRLEDMVHNAVGRLSWHDIFGNFKESELRGDKSQLGLSAVYCALNMYLGAVIGLPRLTQRLDPATGLPLRYVKTTEHPAARIWNHYANDDMDSDELLKRIIYDMLYADGNFYALPEYDQMGRISRCHYIHPTRVPRGNIRRSEGHEVLTIRGGVRRAIKGELIYLVMSGDTTDEAVMLSARDIIHLKGPIPDSEYHRSMGILENNARSAGLYDSAEQMGEQFYRKGATNQMFLSTESKLDPKFQKEMEELFNGEGVRGRSLEDLFTTRILSNGLKPVHVGMTPEVMKFIETRAFSVEDVARWFSIPPSLLHSVMGTGGSEDSDKAMVLWIQTGLGNLLSNIERQFRNNFLPRASQTTFSFVFYRLHLYKTVINEFSQAIRNFFEIGALDRLAIADLIGIHLDPSDKSNTQRYVPANIITTNHSASLEKKAKTSLDVMDQQLIKMQQDLEQSAESFKTSQEIAKNPPESTSDDIPKEPPSDVPNPAEDKPPSEDNSDKKTRPTVPRLDNVARTALYNVIKGLHDFETKVLKQKKESRPNLKEAMNEWYPKLKVTIRTAISPWNTVLETMREELLLREGHEVEDFVDNWEATSRLSLMDLFPEESLESKFSNTFGFLKETKDDSSGS